MGVLCSCRQSSGKRAPHGVPLGPPLDAVELHFFNATGARTLARSQAERISHAGLELVSEFGSKLSMVLNQ